MESLEKKISYSFKDKDLLIQALTHRSYLNENKTYKLDHNERLEFLGDAVLELVATEYLFNAYKKKTEGELTSIRAALVNTVSLSSTASELDLGSFLQLSRGEAKDTGRARAVILANAFEALIGAIYIDGGYKSARDFIIKYLLHKTGDIVEKSLWQDPKSVLQEKAQEYAGVTPAYKTLKEIGPDHSKTFTVGVFLKSEQVGKGTGQSKQEAEIAAAENALGKYPYAT
ncbi:MAG TPA: ribonuclease III [Candidatus Paceibacterota bacterium]